MDLSYILGELGEDRELYFNAVSPPIMQTSNFAFRKVDELGAAFADEMSWLLWMAPRIAWFLIMVQLHFLLLCWPM
jgi:hypothetical protein